MQDNSRIRSGIPYQGLMVCVWIAVETEQPKMLGFFHHWGFLAGTEAMSCSKQDAGHPNAWTVLGIPYPRRPWEQECLWHLANTQMHPPAFHGSRNVQNASVSPASFQAQGFLALEKVIRDHWYMREVSFVPVPSWEKDLSSSHRVLSLFRFFLQSLHLPQHFSAVWCWGPGRALSWWFLPFSSLSARGADIRFSLCVELVNS